MNETLDLIVVGAGPTGIAIGAEARRQGLSVLLVDRGPLTAAIQGYPTFMEFFTTRDRLEIANVPFSIPDAKPTRRQALAYYRMVVERYGSRWPSTRTSSRCARRGRSSSSRPGGCTGREADPARALRGPRHRLLLQPAAARACRARTCPGFAPLQGALSALRPGRGGRRRRQHRGRGGARPVAQRRAGDPGPPRAGTSSPGSSTGSSRTWRTASRRARSRPASTPRCGPSCPRGASSSRRRTGPRCCRPRPPTC